MDYLHWTRSASAFTSFTWADRSNSAADHEICEFHSRWVNVFPAPRRQQLPSSERLRGMRMWRSGSASPCQGEGRGFESRHPLEGLDPWWSGRVVRQRPAKPCTRVRFPSPPRKCVGRKADARTRAISSAGERFPDTEEVTGSIPVSRTTAGPGQAPFRGGLSCVCTTFAPRWWRTPPRRPPPRSHTRPGHYLPRTHAGCSYGPSASYRVVCTSVLGSTIGPSPSICCRTRFISGLRCP